ncbi:RINT1-like protein MAG2 isoform X1 [Punica granatum]|uniref:RINT1-like protein MAG2 isoform X1 n=1 Tax=Punica granatum TaxID=22663 RepID=A0A6P8BV18_PUNGR|nr:RINT1-like protein MAG2 isoform X1 [Punica granatum]
MESAMVATSLPLPPASDLAALAVSFLNERFQSKEDLSRTASLVSELDTQCVDLDRQLIELNSRLGASLVAYSSFSDGIHGRIGAIIAKLDELGSLTGDSDPKSDGRGKKILGEELPALAKEVARVETVRAYAETTLKLDSLIGDVEEAVSSTFSKTLRKQSSAQASEALNLLQEAGRQAIQTLGKIEDAVTEVTKARPQWTHLVSAVDHRVDRALAILRPQAIADHRALLSSLGWPPPLSALSSSGPDASKPSSAPNPLFTMQGDLKLQYCENFLSLCRLQKLQSRRKSRQLEGEYREIALRQPLWAIEELVNPISLASERHFSKWTDRPEFIFALVYKITRDYVDSLVELLQPLVDEANLVGYSCREEWIGSMISSLCTYLAKEIFPIYVSQLEEESISGVKSQARTLWLHLVDLMMSFDKRIKSLVANSGISFSLIEERNLQKLSSLSVFCDRPDWLELWAGIELNDTLDKLKTETEGERIWTKKVQGAVLMSGSEDYRSPAISDCYLRSLSSVIDRCRSLPLVSFRSKFLRLVGAPTIQKFLDCLLLRCQEAEGLTALTDGAALIKVANCVNASRYFESVLKEWCEDIFFIEMGSEQSDEPGGSFLEEPGRGILDQEIKKVEEFRTGWTEKISVVVLRGFDALARDYMKNRRQWQEKGEEGWSVSKSFVGALDHLQVKMSIIQESLNRIDFVCVWRNLADGMDRTLFVGVLLGNMKFHNSGVKRFSHDMEVLFGVFGSWCLRPEGFFPKISEGLKLLRMDEKQLKDSLAGGREALKEHGIRQLSVAEAEKIAKNRVFAS